MRTKHMVVTEHGENDYDVWFTDDLNDELDGGSVRGTLNEIREIVRKELLTVKDLEKDLIRFGWKQSHIGLWVHPGIEDYFIDTNTEIGMRVAPYCIEADRYSNDYAELIK